MRQQRVISGIYAQGDDKAGNIYGTRKGRSRIPAPSPVRILRPVASKMGGVEFTGLREVKVIKSPRRKPLDREARRWYASLSK